eukprot:3554479-Prymnesium_polylepis.1
MCPPWTARVRPRRRPWGDLSWAAQQWNSKAKFEERGARSSFPSHGGRAPLVARPAADAEQRPQPGACMVAVRAAAGSRAAASVPSRVRSRRLAQRRGGLAQHRGRAQGRGGRVAAARAGVVASTAGGIVGAV